MITKFDALTVRNFLQVRDIDEPTAYLAKPVKWRANGKCITWKSKRNEHRFKLPIKHGLFDYGYITNENAHLFDIDKN